VKDLWRNAYPQGGHTLVKEKEIKQKKSLVEKEG
jgi:hypothetical protein